MNEVLSIRKELEKTMTKSNNKRALELLRSLEAIPMTLDVLQKTHIGMAVNKLRKSSDDPEISSMSKSMVKKWKKLLSASSGTSSSTSNSAATNSSINSSANNANSNNNNSNNNNNNNATSNNSTGLNENHSTTSIANNNGANAALSKETSGISPSPSNRSISDTAKLETNLTLSSASLSTQASQQDQRGRSPGAQGSAGSHSGDRPTPSRAPAPHTTSEVRLKARQLLTDALKKPLPRELCNEPLLEEELVAGRIEECIFQEFRGTDIKYKNRFRSRVSNLGDMKNPYLRFKVLRGDIPPEKIAKMTAEEMASDELKKQREQFTKEAINDHQMAMTGGTKTSEIKCPACKKYNCTYNQVQTRSADEPMTTFCLCNECGKRWKFC